MKNNISKYFTRTACTIMYAVFFFSAYAQIDIAEARELNDGEIVTIEGIILNGEATSDLRFIQDETAGIAIYDGSNGSLSVQGLTTGDRVEITGELGTFQGLKEIDFVTEVKYLGPNNPLPLAKVVDVLELENKYQSELVEITCGQIQGEGEFASGEISFSDAKGNDVALFFDNSSNYIGQEIPESVVKLVAINSYQNAVRLLPIEEDAFVEAECIAFVQSPQQTLIEEQNTSFSWASNVECQQEFHLGDSPVNLVLNNSWESTKETIFNVTDLQPGRIYYQQVKLINDQDTVQSEIRPFVTKSASTGEIEIYFNNEVDESFSNGALANGQDALTMDQRLWKLFNEAEETIDIAMYNINRTIIVNYLIDAHNRGVRIRYIADDQTNNNAFNDINPPFGLVYGNPGNSLMHNKFIIVDANLPDKALVMGGSTNFTSNQMAFDPNHIILIQDQSLARAYELEFEEMWGSNTAFPDVLKARYGEFKEDNTPHIFNIDGKLVESYFSPSDNVTSEIEAEIRATTESIDIALLTFTKNELGQAVSDVHDNGVDPRLILENWDDPGSEFNFLKSEGMPIKLHPSNRIFHHKYAIMDEGLPTARVLTGSHNWTNKAEFQNDENTLILHDVDIANIFRQEFEARWAVLVDTRLEEYWNISLAPNPASDKVKILSDVQWKSFVIYDASGHKIMEGERQADLDLSYLNPAIYTIQFNMEKGSTSLRFIKL